MANDFGRVAVLMGGQSAEREISLVTGQYVLDALLRKGVDAVPVDVNTDVAAQLYEVKPDYAFVALHGRGGEDGAIQGLLEVLEIPYSGSSVRASSLTMDKILTKRVWQNVGIPTPDFLLLDELSDLDEPIQKLGLPLCVKPTMEGSSLGVVRVDEKSQLQDAITHAQQFYGDVMFEPWIEGRELTVGILGEQALPVIEIITKRDFYDYEAKYDVDDNEYPCPCDISDALKEELHALSLKAFRVTGCKAWGRVDFMIDKDNRPWMLDLNTIPGMTPHSLVPKAAQVAGVSFDDLIIKIIQESNES